MAGSSLRRLMAEYKRKCFFIYHLTHIYFHRDEGGQGHRSLWFFINMPNVYFLITIDFRVFDQRMMIFYCNIVHSMESAELTLNPPEGIVAGPISEDNFFEWEALIQGPEGTCFEGGVFPARLVFPPDYPLSPPKMKFTCEMFHPNSEYFNYTSIFFLQYLG